MQQACAVGDLGGGALGPHLVEAREEGGVVVGEGDGVVAQPPRGDAVQRVRRRRGVGTHPRDEARTHAAKVGHPRSAVVEEHQSLRPRPALHAALAAALAAGLAAAALRRDARLPPLPPLRPRQPLSEGQAGVRAEDGVDPGLALPWLGLG